MVATTPPELGQAIQKLKILSRSISSQSPKTLAEVYLASIALLVNLKVDQSTLREARKNNGQSSSCPSPESIPAISAVIQDAGLFRALLRCLQSAASSGGESEVSERQGSLQPIPGTRKRSLSLVGEPERAANKIMKLTHSPVPAPRHLTHKATDVGKHWKPSWNVQAMAAAILYTAFQHLDHWPAPLTKAFADDCFGPRLWVDDRRCQLLVENLALAYSAEPLQAGDQQLRDASMVADAYRRFEQILPEESVDDSEFSFPRMPHRGSMSSTGSAKMQRSASSDSLVEGSISRQQSLENNKDDSDSGDEEECILNAAVSDVVKRDDDSSSGEEDEEVVVTSKSNGKDQMDIVSENGVSAPSSAANGTNQEMEVESSPKVEALYPIMQSTLDLTRVRQRFFGENLNYAHDSICSSLLDRLDVKSKQNSGLLQSLPWFTSIPGVRFLIATSLEKWLQSPALAGLARTLFSSTVGQIKNVDPPLEEDLKTIDCVLAMKLKANQFNAHLENVTVIAKRIPTASVANHMYFKLLQGVLNSAETTGASSSDQLKMIAAIHLVIPHAISYEAMAASLLMMLVNPPKTGNSSENTNPTERHLLVKRLRGMIRALASQLQPSFDGCSLMESLLAFDVSSDSWSTRDEEDKARLMFQCVTLFVSPPSDLTARSADTSSLLSFDKSLSNARKLLLTWCCMDYGPRWASRLNRRRIVSEKESDLVVGAGISNFASALGPGVEEKIPSWLNTLRCLLFIEEADSPLMKRFVVPEGAQADDETDWHEERARIQACCEYGVTLDDEMVWTVLKSCSLSEGGMSSKMGIQLLEHLFESCSKARGGSLRVSDPILVWELYNLVEYTPNNPNVSDDERSESPDRINGDDPLDVPRLAAPGLWWRVTMLALIMSAMSPDRIGVVVWEEHPTLRALIKMTTSGRYRFPTVDSDDKMREEMKRCEQTARDEETKIAELLFLPPKQEKIKGNAHGSRVSRRLKKQQQEKEAAKEAAELNRRKKTLRAAQRSIMIWNPVGPARKPPREAADLLMSVEENFALSNVLQCSVKPDFVLLTIGQTTRGAIELAYDWLIPIISRLPGTIDRLPSSASCFLLLRAYGTGGEERRQLRELSAPLLRHVQDSLRGRFGESDAVKAFDLLMSDVASRNPDRRRCARRVLHDALARVGDVSVDGMSPWMFNILHLDDARALVSRAVMHMSIAATFERGKVLCSLLMALEKHIAFAETHEIEVEWIFSSLLVHLISSRPSVYAEAMDSFSDLRSLAIRVAHDAFVRCGKSQSIGDGTETGSVVVVVKPFPSSFLQTQQLKLPLALLQSISVLLSIWKDEKDVGARDNSASGAINDLVGSLMRSSAEEGTEVQEDSSIGLAGAKIEDSNSAAVTVESWIMLAKARSDSIARRAALSAPTGVLPRLLLCSGLPRASLLTMIDRLGRLGDTEAEKDTVYLRLLDPSASSEWDIGRVGQRRDVSRKLLGRLSAYLRLNGVSAHQGKTEVSTAFLDWLSDTCKSEYQKAKNIKSKKGKAAVSATLSSANNVSSSVLKTLHEERLGSLESSRKLTEASTTTRLEFKTIEETTMTASPSDIDDMESVKTFIARTIEKNREKPLDLWLQHNIIGLQAADALELQGCFNATKIAVQLLEAFQEQKCSSSSLQQCILKWIPVLSQPRGSVRLWQLLFSDTEWPPGSMVDGLLSSCIASWSRHHALACCEWIISTSNGGAKLYSRLRMARFLVATSGLPSVQVQAFSEVDAKSVHPPWCASECSVRAASSIALDCSREDSSSTGDSKFRQRDFEPWLALLLLLANLGKEQLRIVCDVILHEFSDSEIDEYHVTLQAAMLRLYLCHPFEMNLGDAAVRDVLTKASEQHAAAWVDWRSSMDDGLAEMLFGVTAGDLKLARPLSDLARKHPLLLLRMLPAITSVLDKDATTNGGTGGEARGVVRGRSLTGPREARIAGRTVQVTIRHWGFNYTEPVWVALLEVISSIPKEVLYSCGCATGLLEFLTTYLVLMSVQLQLLTADKASRLKTKLGVVFAAFKEANAPGWRTWLGGQIGELEVRHVLMSCDFISPMEAVESVKAD